MVQRGRTMLAYADIKPKLCMSFADAEDIELLVAADQGYRDAQNDLGILCLEQERADIGVFQDSCHYFCLKQPV